MVAEIFVKQLDGCTYHSPGDNCNCAAGAMLLFRASQGRIHLTSCQVRVRTGDRSGGTNLEQVQKIATSYGIKTTLYRPGLFPKVQQLIESGRYGAIIQIGYRILRNTAWDCFEGQFAGGHSVFVSAGTSAHAREGDPGADGRRADTPRGYQSMPWDLLERAASGLPLDDAGTLLSDEFGSGRVYALLTPADPAVSSQRWMVQINGNPTRPATFTQLYAGMDGARSGRVSEATYVCLRAKDGAGLWWYRILSKANGDVTVNRNKWFKPNRYVTARTI